MASAMLEADTSEAAGPRFATRSAGRRGICTGTCVTPASHDLLLPRPSGLPWAGTEGFDIGLINGPVATDFRGPQYPGGDHCPYARGGNAKPFRGFFGADHAHVIVIGPE